MRHSHVCADAGVNKPTALPATQKCGSCNHIQHTALDSDDKRLSYWLIYCTIYCTYLLYYTFFFFTIILENILSTYKHSVPWNGAQRHAGGGLTRLGSASCLDRIIFSGARFHLVLFCAVTCHAGWWPGSGGLYRAAHVCGGPDHLGMCKCARGCSHSDEIAPTSRFSERITVLRQRPVTLTVRWTCPSRKASWRDQHVSSGESQEL